ncbi:transcriptional regulator, AsnC family [Croceitalea dokdonensis DOKDO 023]|uniref:Transcriptional regulator, AsnC family n=1 Tax=Croceitalea dokdonensis DOKDO 023 TaxID=1300341 RepID=A0A0P7AY17_9FLAO|nr:Lrp/AsnC family transcriptional regulator [Croceitalea dokdonensis]KPM33098.1 transcriptional regulator, AsnC family [Croceitalea dokdonensis DOKDO 023]
MVDDIDKKILQELKDNARISFANLAREINLSPSAVRERVQKMEDLGVIQNYVVQTDNKMLGYDLEAFILIKVFPGKLKHVIQSITEFPEITEAHRITGNQNIHLKVLIKDQIHLQKLLDQLMDFGDTNTFLILTRIGD